MAEKETLIADLPVVPVSNTQVVQTTEEVVKPNVTTPLIATTVDETPTGWKTYIPNDFKKVAVLGGSYYVASKLQENSGPWDSLFSKIENPTLSKAIATVVIYISLLFILHKFNLLSA